jgi:PAS domain S-box-containing protein
MAVAVWHTSQARQEREAVLHRDAEALARAAAAEQARIIDGGRQLLAALGAINSVQTSDAEACARSLPAVAAEFPAYTVISATSVADGRVFCSSGAVGADVSDRAWFRDALRTRGFAIGELVVGRVTGRHVLHLASTALNDLGEATAVLSAALELERMGEMLAKTTARPNAALLVTDRDGRILVSRPDRSLVGSTIPDDLRPLLLAGGPGTATLHWAGAERILSFVPLGTGAADLFVAVGLDREAELESSRRRGMAEFATFLLTALASLGAATWLGLRSIAQPLATLEAVAERWRKGNLSSRTGMSGPSDIGRLGAAFDAMADEIAQRERALRAALENMRNGVLVLDEAWRITYLNRRGSALLDGRRDMVGLPLQKALPHFAGGAFTKVCLRCSTAREPVEAEHEDAWSGRRFSFWAQPSEDGGITIFFRDVTEEHARAARLAAAESLARDGHAELEQIYRHAPVGLFAFDRDCRCLRINERMASMTGFPVEFHIGRHMSDFVPKLAGRMVELWRPVLERGDSLLGIEVQGETPAAPGETRTWLASYFPVRSGTGDVVGLIGAVLDITERKQAEERLRELEARNGFLLRLGDTLRPLQDAAEIQAEACRLLGQHLGVAQVGFAPIDGQQRHVVVRQDWNDGRIPSVVGTWAMDDFGPAFIRALKRGETVAIPDVTQDARTGTPGAVAAYEAIRTRAILDVPLVRNGRMAAMLFIHHPEPRDWTACDISLVQEVCERLWAAVERAAAEGALRASEARYRVLTEAGSHLTWVMRPDQSLSFVSRTWREFTGIEDDELSSDAWLSGVHPDDRARLLAETEPSIVQGVAHGCRFRARRADGVWRWLLARAEPVQDADGSLLEWVGTAVDIHDLAETQAALTEAEERLRLALEAADLATWDQELGTETSLWSPRVFAMLGYKPDPTGRATFRMWTERVHPEDMPAIVAERARAEAAGCQFHMQYRIIRRDGELRWLESHGRFLAMPDGRRRSLGVLRDVTAEQTSRQRLADAEERLRLALEGTDEGLWDWNMTTGAVWFSDRWCTMIGYAPGEVEPHVRSWEKLVHPDDRTEVLQVLDAHLEGRTPLYSCEHRVRHRDGGWVWILDRGKVVARDGEGRPLRMVGTHQDITRRKAAEDALAASEARLRSVVRTAADGILLADTEGRIVSANPAAADMFGHAGHGSLIGTKLTDLMPPEEAERHDEHLDRHLRRYAVGALARSVRGAGRELLARRRDGTLFPVEIAVASFTTGTERLFTGVVRDVTLRKQAEAALRDNEERFRALVEGVTDYAIVMLDVEGRITSWNTGAERMTGWTEDEVIGQNFAMLRPAAAREDDHHEAALEAARRDGVFRGEGERLRRDGSTYLAEVTLTALLDQAGRPRGFAKVTRDITARRAAEARLSALQAQTMRASRLSASGALAAGLAHELNQPLSAIANYSAAARMALQRAQEGGQGSTQTLELAGNMLQEASVQAIRAGDIIRRLREFVGQTEAELTGQPAALIVREACEEAEAALRCERDGALSWRLEADVADNAGDIFCDAVQLQLVLANFIRNARDAVRKDAGLIRVSASRATDGGGVQFSVADDGPGLDANVASRLFEPFVSTKPSGLGIGLAICRTIVEGHGGRVWAEPHGVLGGATFHFLIPASEGQVGLR